jgi:trans-2,3-dihydro-3-hydroxyanthranilate isomerase
MRAIRLRLDVWERILRDFAAPHVFVFTQEVMRPTSTVHSRMFAPAMGIAEDPATGAASGPLGCYLPRDAQRGSAPHRLGSWGEMSNAVP